MSRPFPRRGPAIAGLLFILVALLAQPAATPSARAQSSPDWLSEEGAASLAVGITVLVPPALPSPFSGEPSITASSGSYRLYWFVGGGEPTFLDITGTAGGSIPDFSKYDRNVELTQNATVQGYPAYHDATPIYDLVYWDAGGVVYSVEVQNAAGDALSIANSLTALSTPEPDPEPNPDTGPGPDPGEETGTDATATVTSPDSIAGGEVGNVTVSASGPATLTTDLGEFVDTGTASVAVSGEVTVAWRAPAVEAESTATFSVIDDATGALLASTPTVVEPVETQEEPTEAPVEIPWSMVCPPGVRSGERVSLTVRGRGDATLTANAGQFAGNAPAATVSVDGSATVEWTAPSDADGTTATITLTADEESAAACEIEIGAGRSDDRATRRPNAFPGDGTDLSLGRDDEPELADLLPTATPTATVVVVTGGPLDDGTGIREGPLIATPVVNTPTPDPDDTPEPTETPRPTATSTPENPIPTLVPATSDDGRLVAQEIGPEGGRLPTDFGAEVRVPAGASEERMIVTVQRIEDDALPIGANIDLVPDSGVEVTLARSDGRMIDNLPQPALLRIDLGERYESGATLYELADGELIALENVQTDGDTLEVPIRRVSRVVAGVPIGQATTSTSTSTRLVPFVIVALTLVIVMVVVGSVIGSARRRRPRSVVPRRVISSRAR